MRSRIPKRFLKPEKAATPKPAGKQNVATPKTGASQPTSAKQATQASSGCSWADKSRPGGVCGRPKVWEGDGNALCEGHLRLLTEQDDSDPEDEPTTEEAHRAPAKKPAPPKAQKSLSPLAQGTRAIASKPREKGGIYRFGLPAILVIFSHPILYLSPVIAIGAVYLLLTDFEFREGVFANVLASIIFIVIPASVVVWARLVYERGRYLVFDTAENVVTYFYRPRAFNPFSPMNSKNVEHVWIPAFDVEFTLIQSFFGIGQITLSVIGPDRVRNDIVFKVMDPERVKDIYFAWSSQNLPEEALDEMYAKWQVSHGVLISLLKRIWRLFRWIWLFASSTRTRNFGTSRAPKKGSKVPLPVAPVPPAPVKKPTVIGIQEGRAAPPKHEVGQNFIHCSINGCPGHVTGALERSVRVIWVYIRGVQGKVAERTYYLHDPETEIPQIVGLWKSRDFNALKQKLDFGDAVFPG